MKLIILDRDGVINHDSDEYIKSVDEFIPIDGSLEAIAKLNHAGYSVMVATNQSGIARGMFNIETLNAMHNKLRMELNAYGGRIDGIFFCPHGPDDHCQCRKPLPGLFHDIAQRVGHALNDVPAIGDSYRDIQAARAVGATPVLLKTGKGSRTLASKADALQDVPVFNDLSDFVDNFLQG
jgi:D-glycero-D-manno-heptose 1,7-bisphosphate phosphatase